MISASDLPWWRAPGRDWMSRSEQVEWTPKACRVLLHRPHKDDASLRRTCPTSRRCDRSRADASLSPLRDHLLSVLCFRTSHTKKKTHSFWDTEKRQKAFATALSAYESSCEPATSGQLLGSDKSVAFPPRKAHANPPEHGLDTPSHTRVYTCIYTHTCCGAEDGMQNMENPPREQRHAELTQRARSRFGGRLRAPEGLQCALRFALAMAKVTMHHTWHIYTLRRERRR